jgi:hypothetical protein
MDEKPVVLLCASQQDQSWAEKLAKNLRPMLGEGHVAVSAGNGHGETSPTYREPLERARVAVLLTSPDFVADYAGEPESKPEDIRLLEERQASGLTRIFRLPVRPSMVDKGETPLAKYPSLLDFLEPLSTLSDAESEKRLVEAAAKLRDTAFPKNMKPQTMSRLTGKADGPPPVVDVDRWMPLTAEQFVGRRQELKQLDGAWTAPPPVRIVSLVGCGGSGKTALVKHWLKQLKKEDYRGARRVLAFSFHDDTHGTVDEFFRTALRKFGEDLSQVHPREHAERLAALFCEVKTLLVLDGLEAVQSSREDARWAPLREFLLAVQHAAEHTPADRGPSLCVITTREPIKDLAERRDDTYQEIQLSNLSLDEGVKLLRDLRVSGGDDDLKSAVADLHGHALSLHLLASELKAIAGGDSRQRDRVRLSDVNSEVGKQVRAAMERYDDALEHTPELAALRILALFDGPVERKFIDDFAARERVPELTDAVGEPDDWRRAVSHLMNCGLVRQVEVEGLGPCLETYPIIREHYEWQLRRRFPGSYESAQRKLYERRKRNIPRTAATLADLHPAMQTVYHACRAGLPKDAADIYFLRIKQGQKNLLQQMGAHREDLAVIGYFFTRKWYSPLEDLPPKYQAYFLKSAAERLVALERTDEARSAYEAAEKAYTDLEDWDKVKEVREKLSTRQPAPV